MDILILGGTRFVGRHFVEAALAHGHRITLFNRGQSNPQLFPEVEQLHGNRDGDLDVLKGRHWDTVVDTSGYVPRIVRASAEALSNAVDRYVFISSISVYANFDMVGMDENAPVAHLDDESVEEVTEETYGALKALCEQAVEQVMPGRALIIRPGLIVGPDDQTDRFTYWPYRVAQGGEMLAPGDPQQGVQFIDVRDLTAWILHMVEQRATGIYQATGPDYALSMGHFLDTCKTVTDSNVQFIWVNDAFLTAREVWLPIYVPNEYIGMRAVNCQKAIKSGLTFRPLEETIRDTLAWRGKDIELTAGLTPEQEQGLLEEWKKEQQEDTLTL